MDELLSQLARRVQSKYYGKFRGLVVSNDDPEQLGRVQLKVPSVLGDQTTSWALPCVPFGGSRDTGWFAVPEVGAQLWVEFEEGDLRRPIWTGTFWQKPDDVPPDARKASASTRMLQTPSGHILQFDDEPDVERIRLHHRGGAELTIDENGTVAIKDQAGSVLTLDADAREVSLVDSHGNAVALSSSGIKIEDVHRNSIELAPAGVKISAAAQIVLDAPVVMLGGSGGEPLLKGSTFLSLFNTHVHLSSAPGAPTSPPAPPTPAAGPTALSTSVLTK